MASSLLANAFVEVLKNEWLGIVASTIILISFLTSNQVKTRIINMVGCVVFVVYGILLPAYSTAFMNGALFIVHIVFLTKYFIGRRKEKNAKAEERTPAATEGSENELTENAEPDASGEKQEK